MKPTTRPHRWRSISCVLALVASALLGIDAKPAVAAEWGNFGAFSYTVPTGVTVVKVVARGGSGSGASGGKGTIVTAFMEVTPGETLDVRVGGHGFYSSTNVALTAGYNGGGQAGGTYSNGTANLIGYGGGGGSDVRRCGGTGCALTDRFVVAGGGGGGSNAWGGDQRADGGNGGGVSDGGDGATAAEANAGAGGQGGSRSAGGAGGAASPAAAGSTAGQSGALGQGGNGGNCVFGGTGCGNMTAAGSINGAGGGGGYYGGGGGGGGAAPAGSITGGAGGGGSSYVDLSTSVLPPTYTVASNFADGYVGIFPNATFTGGTLTGGVVNSAYTHTFSATGGTAPLAWLVTSGSLPTGLALNLGTGELSGTPTAGGTFNFDVQVLDSDGLSTTESVTLTISLAPGPPTGVSASRGNGQATVNFSAPGNPGGSAITGYTVTSDPGSFTGTCSASPCTVTGLQNGTPYTFTVHATNGNGNSAESSPSTAVTPATVPGAPTAVSAQEGNGQATVTFSVPGSTGGSPITGYTATSDPGGFTGTCSVSPCTVTGLSNGTAYTFTVRATNAVGPGAASSPPSTGVTPATVPATPVVTVTPGDARVTVSFPTPADGGSAITTYQVSTDNGTTWATLATTTANGIVSGAVTGLQNGTAYPVTVRARNAKGDSTGSTAQNVTPASVPGAPTAVTATAADGQAVVRFTAPGTTGGSPVTGYTATSDPGGFTGTCSVSPCTVTGLSNGTAYTFTVRATNVHGSSPASAASAAVTPSAAPSAPVGLAGTSTPDSVTLTFTVPASGGAPITGYQYSTDNGATWQSLGVTVSGATGTVTLTGLPAGTGYTIQVRATNDIGNGAAASVTTGTTAVPPGAPTATVGPTSATVTWPQATTQTVTGYTVYASPGPATCSTTSISDTSCVIGAAVGTSYTYTVVAHSPGGNSAPSTASNSITPQAPPVPVTVPTAAPTTLTTTQGKLDQLRPAQQITVVGTGFAPFSTATIIIYSEPKVLGTVVTDTDGNFSVPVSVPADLAAGAHNVVASGVDPNGAVHQIRMPVTVTATAAGALPVTGPPVGWVTLWGLIMLGAGVGLIRRSRDPLSRAGGTTAGAPAARP